MLLNGTVGRTRLTLNLRPGWLTVAFDGVDVLTYDRAGRLWSRWTGGRTFRRGLDGRVMEKWQERGQRQRRWLTPAQAASLLDEGATRMSRLAGNVTAGRVEWADEPEDDALVRAIDRAARFDAQAAELDQAGFARVYDPIGILPPDQYLALVLQATCGCSFNTCTFCDFYSAERFRIKSDQAFRDHVQAVRDFMGDSILARRSIFLGEANALTIPFDRLEAILTIAREVIGDHGARSGTGEGWPVYAFLDAFSGAKKSIAEYRRLAELGLRRVSIGVESGHDPLLKFVRKPGTARDAVDTVASLKAAGIAVSVIVLIGLGGDRYAVRHAADTAATLNAMPLGRSDVGDGDIIYFSDLIEHSSTAYPALARAEGIRPLTGEEMHAQRRAIRSGLRFGAGGPVISKYDIREFMY